jgi:WD40 repeat protein
VGGLVVSRDGQLLASSDENGELIVWYAETDESLIQLIKAHFHWINLSTGIFYFSPDGTVLVTASSDNTTKLWNAKTWQQQGKSIECGCSTFSPQIKVNRVASLGGIMYIISDAN